MPTSSVLAQVTHSTSLRIPLLHSQHLSITLKVLFQKPFSRRRVRGQPRESPRLLLAHTEPQGRHAPTGGRPGRHAAARYASQEDVQEDPGQGDSQEDEKHPTSARGEMNSQHIISLTRLIIKDDIYHLKLV